MPNYDKTGPAGQGSMTGQGLGSCAGNQQANSATFAGRGMGLGLGFRRGRGAGCCGRGFRNNNAVSLEDQEKFLEERLEAVRKLKSNSKN